MDDPEKVTSELRSFAGDGDADAFFVEMPDDVIDPSTLALCFLRAPLYFFGLIAVGLFFQFPLFVYYNRQPRPTERIAVQRLVEQRDVPVHGVDPTLQRLTEVGPVTTALNWVVLALVLSFSPLLYGLAVALTIGWFLVVSVVVARGHPHLASVLTVLAPVGLIAAVVVGRAGVLAPLLVGVFAFGVGAHQTLQDRNEQMLARTADLAADHDYDTGVLVTGKKHLHGLALLAAERSIPVPAVHVSMWTEEGTRLTDFAPAELPGSVPESGAKHRRSAIRAGSESAARLRRAAAALVDLFPVTFCFVIALLVVGSLFQSPLFPWVDSGGGVGVVLAGLLAFVGYHAGVEWYYGTTLGKDLFGLAVVSAEGGPLSGRQALVRNLLRPVDAVGGYLLGAAAMIGTDRSQRLGDVAAGTVVGRRDSTPAGEDSAAVPGEQPRGRHPRLAFHTVGNSFGKRASAAVLDKLIATLIGLIALIVVLVGLNIFAGVETETLDGPLTALSILIVLLSTGAYYAVAEWRYGTTLGKWKAGLVVAGADGEQLTAGQALVRNAVRVVEVALLYVPSLLAIGMSDRDQRPGDLVANTVVGRTERAAAAPDADHGADHARTSTDRGRPNPRQARGRRRQSSARRAEGENRRGGGRRANSTSGYHDGRRAKREDGRGERRGANSENGRGADRRPEGRRGNQPSRRGDRRRGEGRRGESRRDTQPSRRADGRQGDGRRDTQPSQRGDDPQEDGGRERR